ncbi:MAG: hypothetical protein K6U02_02865 [Firmicutes bacterium]|nr:hypothetical protein [Bacillota bacterium]
MRKRSLCFLLLLVCISMLLPALPVVNSGAAEEVTLTDGVRPTPPAPPKGGVELADGVRPTPPAPPKHA